ncbi:MAG TPA: hypothetical protein VLT82_14325 [Myxococcaceae bacterium]|nr:hypothetical protein [Myxococcaceae bacterium]
MRPSRSSPPLLRLAPGLALLALAGCAHAPPPAEPAAPAPTEGTRISEAERAALAGTWVYAGDDAELAQVEQAVERATADMGFLARGFAFEALRARARPRPTYVLTFEGSTVSIASPDHPTERGEVGGPPVGVTDRFGDENQTTFRLRDGALVEAGKSADGSGETVFTPSADGRTLRVRRLMQSSRLSAPVDVTLSYRRLD